MEEATLDFANAAPGNKGRQRVTDQVRIRIVSQHQLQPKRNNLEFGCEYGCAKFTFAISRGGGGNI